MTDAIITDLLKNAAYAIRSDIQYMRELGRQLILAAAEIKRMQLMDSVR